MKIIKIGIKTISLAVITPIVVIAVLLILMAVILLIPASFIDGAIEGITSKMFKEDMEEKDVV